MKAILERKSVRKYTDQAVSPDTIQELLQAAMSAPTSNNKRPWHFVVVREREILTEIPKYSPYAQAAKAAPAAIIVCADLLLEKSIESCGLDCAAATENILIAAQDIRLGAVWLTLYPERERMDGIQKLLGLPESVLPFMVVPIGYPAENRSLPKRFDETRIHYDRW